jgi:hypothetical protein
MKKVLTLTLMLLVFVPSVLRAQTNTEPISCFDYYKFGSVYASLETRNYTNVSGTKINFFGEIKNDNAYPIVDGKLFVKIMRSNDSYDKTGGQDEVDSFAVKEGISIPANSSIPVSFDWNIPGYAISGEYQASTYFLVDDSFNMSGLSFTTDIVGGVAKFSVVGEQKSDVYFDRTQITINDNPYYTVAFTPSVRSTSTANISLTLTNDTNKMQEVPVTLSLYEWDSQAQKNLLKTEDTSYIIAANSSKKISYEITDTKHSVYFLVAKATYKDAKSEVSVRFGRQGKQEPRINFSTFANYPFEKGKENSLITCVHNTNQNDAEYGKVVTTVYDHNGNQIHTSLYEGKITGAIQGMISKFTPSAAYKDLTIATKIYDKEGGVIDETSVEYKCSDLLEDCEEPFLLFNLKTLITIISLILLIGIIIFIGKHMKKRNLFTPLVIMFMLGVMMVPGVGEASLSTSVIDIFGRPVTGVVGDPIDWYTAMNLIGYTDSDYVPSWLDIHFSVDYHAKMFDHNTGQSINSGSIINEGTVLDFQFGPFNWSDIVWYEVGTYQGTPYGDWVDGAANTLRTEFKKIFNSNDIFVVSEINNKINPFVQKYSFWSNDSYVPLAYGKDGYYPSFLWHNFYGQLSVNPPEVELVYAPEDLACEPIQKIVNGDSFLYTKKCIVSKPASAKAISPIFKFKETVANFYGGFPTYTSTCNSIVVKPTYNLFRYDNVYDVFTPGYENCPIKNLDICTESDVFSSCSYYLYKSFELNEEQGSGRFPNNILVSEINISFPITIQPNSACLTNATPTAPTININPASPIINEDATITLSSTDTENDAISYQVDWGDGQPIIMPASFPKKWTATGTVTFKVRATDTCHQSEWVSKTVTITSAPPPQTPALILESNTCNSAALTWNMKQGETYNLYKNGDLVQANAQSPQSVSGLSEDETYTFRLIARRGLDTAESNAVSVSTGWCPPTCDTSGQYRCNPSGSTSVQEQELLNYYQWKCSYHGQTTNLCTFPKTSLPTDPSLEFTILPKLAPNCIPKMNVKDVKSCKIMKGGTQEGPTYTANGSNKIEQDGQKITNPGMYNLECIDVSDQTKISNYQSCISDFTIIQD